MGLLLLLLELDGGGLLQIQDRPIVLGGGQLSKLGGVRLSGQDGG